MNPRIFFSLLWKAVQSWFADSAARHGAAIAYYAIFALAPVLLVVIAIAGAVFGEDAARGQIVTQIAGLIGHDGAEAVQAILRRANASGRGISSSIIGTLALIFATTGAFLELQAALNKIWHVKPREGPAIDIKNILSRRLRSLGVVASIGFLLLVSLAVSAAVSALAAWLGDRAGALPLVISIFNQLLFVAVATALFAILYRVLPDVHLKWRHVLVGAFTTAVLFTIGQRLIGLYLGSSTVASPFGAAGALAIILVWVYYSAQILLLGAEFTYQYATYNFRKPEPMEGAVHDERSESGGTRAAGPRVAHTVVRALVLGAVISMPTGPLAAQRGESENAHPLVRSITLRGVSKVDRRLLAEGLATKSSKCKNVLYAPICLFTRSPVFSTRRYLDGAELRRDELRIRLFYWRRGYRDVDVSSSVNPVRGGGVRVVFNIKENAPTIIEKLIVEQQDSVLPNALISRTLRVKEHEPLNLVALDSTMLKLHEALWDRGYADADIQLDTSKVDNSRNAGAVTIVLQPGPRTIVRAVEIEGNTEVTDLTIRRMLRFQPGGLYRRSAILESQRDLYLSGLFSEVDVGALPSKDSAKTIQVRLTEAPLRNVDIKAGITTADFLQFESQFTRYNFLGGARRLTLRTTVSNVLANQLNGNGIFYDVTNGAVPGEREPFLRPTWSASVELNQPWFISPRNQLTTTFFTHRRSVPGVVTDVGGGGTISMTRDLALRTNMTLGYTYEASKIEASDVYFCVSAGLCVPSTIRIIADRHPLSPIALVGQYDGTNSAFTPMGGMRGRIEFEYASRLTASDYQYGRASATVSKYFRTSPTSVLATRVRLGFVRALSGTNRTLGVPDDTASLVLHPRKQFFAGGSQSVRGYGENQLGPRVLTIDPAKLTDTSRSNACSVDQLIDGTCDPNQIGIRARDFQPRPLGGTSLAEANIELRFPIPFAQGLTGAVFLDGAVVGTRRFEDLFSATGAITPGFGVRFSTPVGPVRLDLGIRPRTVDYLPVITQVTDSSGQRQLVTLKTRRRFDESETSGRSLRKVLNRLTLHLAIGPAF